MTEMVRRSWLLVPASDAEQVSQSHLTDADVVVLDLVEFVAERDKPRARELMVDSIELAKAGGAEVFAQVDPELLYADLRACVWPGLSGIVITRLETVQQAAEAHELLGCLEEERGILPDTLEIVGALETAKGNRDGYEIAVASPRIWGLTLGRADLVMDLRPEPTPESSSGPSQEIHLMQYLMQRLITLAGAAGAAPLGAWWRGLDRGLLATPENTYRAAFRGRAIGFKGSFCVKEDQVGPLNQGFTPTDFETGSARSLLQAYQEGLAQGAAAMRWGDRVVDSGAAAQAQHTAALALTCFERDQAKSAALEQRPIPAP